MTTQVVVRMPERLVKAVDAAAKRMAGKRSEVVRLAVEAWLAGQGKVRSRTPKVRSLLGSLETGIPDLARRHREYLVKTLPLVR